jgi:hypothetical protein
MHTSFAALRMTNYERLTELRGMTALWRDGRVGPDDRVWLSLCRLYYAVGNFDTRECLASWSRKRGAVLGASGGEKK